MKKANRIKAVNALCAVVYMLTSAFALLFYFTKLGFELVSLTAVVPVGALALVILTVFLPKKKSHAVILMCSLLFQAWPFAVPVLFEFPEYELIGAIGSAATIVFTAYTSFSKNCLTQKCISDGLPLEGKTLEKASFGKAVRFIAAISYTALCLYTSYFCFDIIGGAAFIKGTRFYNFADFYIHDEGAAAYLFGLLPYGILACIVSAIFARKKKIFSVTIACSSVVQILPLIYMLVPDFQNRILQKIISAYGFVAPLAAVVLVFYLCALKKDTVKTAVSNNC